MTRASVLLPLPLSPTTATRAAALDGDVDVLQDADGTAAIGGARPPDLEQRRLGRARGLRVLPPGRDQRLGVGLARCGQDLRRRAGLDHLAVAQDQDAVGDLGHHGEVVADVEGGRAVVADRLPHRGQDLDLGGDVERGGRLVEDDEVGPAGQRHRHHRPLQLAARGLVRVAVAERVGIGQAQLAVEAGGDPLAPRPPLAMPCRTRTSPIWASMRLGRVEGGGGTLRHVGDAAAAQLEPRPWRRASRSWPSSSTLPPAKRPRGRA